MFFNSIKEINRLLSKRINTLRKEINRLLSKGINRLRREINRLLGRGMSSIYLNFTIEKNRRTQYFDFLNLKNVSPGQFLGNSKSRRYH